MNEIAKCPFCESVCEMDNEIDESRDVYVVACVNEKCSYRSNGAYTEAEAIADHNSISDAVATQPDLLAVCLQIQRCDEKHNKPNSWADTLDCDLRDELDAAIAKAKGATDVD